eukprot:scpid88118/ scgid14534/ 
MPFCSVSRFLVLTALLSQHGALASLSSNCKSVRGPAEFAAPTADNWAFRDAEEPNWTTAQQVFTDAGIADISLCMDLLMGRSQCAATSTVVRVYTGTVQAVENSLSTATQTLQLAEQLKQNSHLHRLIPFELLEPLIVNISAIHVAGEEWNRVGCTNVLERCRHWNSSTERVHHFQNVRHCYAQAEAILRRAVRNAAEVRHVTALHLLALDFPANASGSYDVLENETVFTSTRPRPDEWTRSILNDTVMNSSSWDQSILFCFLHRSSMLYRFAKMQESLAMAETALHSFRQGLSAVLRPTNFTWDLPNEISLVVCSAMVNKDVTLINETIMEKTPGIQLCCNRCCNTHTLITALATIQPHVFFENSSQGYALQFLRKVFTIHCPRPEFNQCVGEDYPGNVTCTEDAPLPNSTEIGRYPGSVVDAHQHPYCTSTVY